MKLTYNRMRQLSNFKSWLFALDKSWCNQWDTDKTKIQSIRIFGFNIKLERKKYKGLF